MSSSHRIVFEVREKPRATSKLQGYKEAAEEELPLRAHMYQPMRSRLTEESPHVRYLAAIGRARKHSELLEMFGISEPDPLDRHLLALLGISEPEPPRKRFAGSLQRLADVRASRYAITATRMHLGLVTAFCAAGPVDLQDPWIGVGEDGSIGVDWQHDGRRLAVTFDAAGTSEFYAKDACTEQTGPVTSVADQVRLVSWLAHGRELPGH